MVKRFCIGPGCVKEIAPIKRKGTKFCGDLCRVRNSRLSKRNLKHDLVEPRGSLHVSHAAIAFAVAKEIEIAFTVAKEIEIDVPYETLDQVKDVLENFKKLAVLVFAKRHLKIDTDDLLKPWENEYSKAKALLKNVADSQ